MLAAGLQVSERCTKKRWTRSPCEACGRLFRKTEAFGMLVRSVSHPKHGIDRDVISKALLSLLARTWVEASPFTPVSMLRGWISTAIAANVPTEIRDLQSGHKSDARKEYAELADKALLWVGGGCVSYTLRMPPSLQLLSGGGALSRGH
eukprot:537830-Rhodomonas_salina.1